MPGIDQTQAFSNRKTQGSNCMADQNLSRMISPSVSFNKSGIDALRNPMIDSATAQSILSSSRWAAGSSQMSPRIQELKRIKQQRYLKLDAIKQHFSSQQQTDGIVNKDIHFGQSKLSANRQSTALPGGTTTRRNLKLGKKLCYQESVNYNSPTCLSSMRERDIFHEALFRQETNFYNQVKQSQFIANMKKLNSQAAQNIPQNTLTMLYPLPDKHLANVSLDRIHTTRRAQVLKQEVAETALQEKKAKQIDGVTKPERVFLRSNPKPLETTTTFPEQLIGSNNNFDLFLDADPQKAMVFKHFRNFSRDLTKAYLR